MDSYMPQTYLHNHANHNQYTNNNENVYDRLYGNKVNTINGVKNEDDDYTLNFGSDLAMEKLVRVVVWFILNLVNFNQ